MTYVEVGSDFAFSAFLARVTPGDVRRDLESRFTKEENKIRAHVKGLKKEVARVERNQEIALALELARLMSEKGLR